MFEKEEEPSVQEDEGKNKGVQEDNWRREKWKYFDW